MADLDPDGPVPLWQQLADVLAARIADGTYQPNRRLPSETSLQQEFGVARVTARHAVQELRARDLVITTPQKGTYVKPAEQ